MLRRLGRIVIEGRPEGRRKRTRLRKHFYSCYTVSPVADGQLVVVLYCSEFFDGRINGGKSGVMPVLGSGPWHRTLLVCSVWRPSYGVPPGCPPRRGGPADCRAVAREGAKAAYTVLPGQLMLYLVQLDGWNPDEGIGRCHGSTTARGNIYFIALNYIFI